MIEENMSIVLKPSPVLTVPAKLKCKPKEREKRSRTQLLLWLNPVGVILEPHCNLYLYE